MLYRLIFSIFTAFVGAGLVIYSHYGMAGYIGDGDLQRDIRAAEELYGVAMKSEVEAARLGYSISLYRANPDETFGRSSLLDGLDIMFSRLHLHDKSAVYSELRENEEYANTLRSIERSLEGLDAELGGGGDIDFERTLALHARLSVALNEVTRMSLDYGSQRHDALKRQVVVFGEQQTNLMWLGVAVLFVSFLPIIFMSREVIRAKREGHYELV